MTNTELVPYVERYRPKEFDEVIGIRDLDRFEEIIRHPMEMPSLLFHGPPGTGKSSLIKIILNKLKPIDFIRINGSDTTGVDTIREQVYNFMTSKSSVPGKPKIVWIEEIDFISVNAAAALRAMSEQFVKNARFLASCNYLYKIPEPLQSRFSKFEFTRVEPKAMFNRIRAICDTEGINVKDDTVVRLINMHKGDMRSVINSVQQLSSNPQKVILVTDLKIIHTLANEIFQLIKDKNWTYIRKEIPKQNPEYNTILVELDELFFNSEFSTDIKAEVNDIIARILFEIPISFDKNITFSACCYRIIKKLNELESKIGVKEE